MADETENIEETEVPAVEAEAADAEASEAAAPSESAEAPAIVEQLTPKQRKERKRAEKAQQAGPKASRTPEERHAEREEIRAAKAKARSRRREQERAKYKAAEHERVPTPPRDHVVGLKKTRQGIVVSDKAEKTITVRIDTARPHRKYKKIVRTSTTVHAHDESNNANIGDTVVVQESRPLSATKRWRLVEVVERAK